MAKYQTSFDTKIGSINFNMEIDAGETLDSVLPDVLSDLEEYGYVLKGWHSSKDVIVIWEGRELNLTETLTQQGVRSNDKLIVAVRSEAPRSLRVFLCHSSNDKAAVRNLYHRLCVDGIEAWLDEEKLLPGQDWQQEIQKAIRDSDVVIICLSKAAVNKSGYVQKEIKEALSVADEHPDNTIFIIPIRLEECDVHERLRRLQWVNLFEEKGYEQLMRALRARAGSLGITA